MKDNIKKAVESAEQEIQEKEIANLKKIVKDLLEKKIDLEKDYTWFCCLLHSLYSVLIAVSLLGNTRVYNSVYYTLFN